MMQPNPGSQLTAVLFGLGAGRAKTPAWRSEVRWAGATLTLAGKASAAGYSVSQAIVLDTLWRDLPPRLRSQVLEPLRADHDGIVRWGDEPAQQIDNLTCGAAALAMLAAAGDPAVALWVVTGANPLNRDIISRRTRSALEAAGRADTASPGQRFAALQHSIRWRTIHRRSLSTWPRRWGTPPWGAARAAEFGKVRYASRMIDDLDSSNLRRVMSAALSAVQCGVPVPLYTGGDSRDGYQAAVPRHVVLLHAPSEQQLATYEPSSARIIEVEAAALAHGGTAQEAYGGWSHLTWALIPDQQSRGW